MKRTYTATLPDGTTATRRTERTYTHVVAGRRPDEDAWGVYAWCGRLDLAEKQAAHWSRFTAETRIVEVNP